MPRVLLLTGVLTALVAITGCQTPAVGDPCTPEAVPEGGFVASEAYLETSSVQCRTRVCMVYKLSGDPRIVPPAPGAADPGAVEDRVYCTCRCRAPSDPDATICECPEGFTCTEILELGGPGVRGSYCVKTSTVDSEG